MTASEVLHQMTEQTITETQIRIVDQGRGETWVFPSPGEAPLDRDQLLLEIREELGVADYYLDDTCRRTSWGAEGTALEIVLTVGQIAGSLAGVIALIDRALEHMRSRSGALREELTAESAVDGARHAVAVTGSHQFEDIEVHEVVESNDAYRVSLSHTGSGDSFSVEVGPTGVSHISRSSPGGIRRRGFFRRKR